MKKESDLAGSRSRGHSNGNASDDRLTDQLFKRQLLASLTALRDGDFSARMPGDLTGLDGKIADAFNDVVGRIERFDDSLDRLQHAVGRKGKFNERLARGDAKGGWRDSVEAVNTLVDDMSRPTLEMGRVIGAVAKGDLSQSVSLEISGQPLQGEHLRTAKLVNGMVEQLAGFSVEVIRVAREVGIEGKLGGQAQVKKVSGVWRELTESVNQMAGNLTAQVRNIADVTIAVANGDLSKKITVDVRGEILQLKEAINTMVEQLRSFASEVTRVAREVGSEGRLGGQAFVPGVAGTWKDLTDNVNSMASNLTAQVRNIAQVTTAVARGTWRQLKIASANMDTLVALGSSTAFAYSAWALISGIGGQLYFMEAAAIITFISGGHWIEARVTEKAGNAMKTLLNLAPQTAQIVLHQPERTHEISVSELRVNDEILLRPGDRVPVDGVAIEGESTVDESALTGEAIPAEKKTGQELFTGTVNLTGRLVMRVTAIGEETALAHVIAAVQRAQTSRADIQRLGDRFSAVFVPVVVLLALATGLWWGFSPESAHAVHHLFANVLWAVHIPVGAAAGFIIAAAVLIISCPCAMGLATPAALMAAANAAARRGILIRDGIALEKAGTITALIFDKTGTLTSGKPEVASTLEIQQWRLRPKTLAAAIARNSSHPVSRPIAGLAGDNIDFDYWREMRGSGIEATVQGIPGKIRLGSLRWLAENGVDLSPAESFIAKWTAAGATVTGLAAEKTPLAFFAVLDILKPDAANVVKRLRAQNFKIFMVTGDNARTACGIAAQLSIPPEHVVAEAQPVQKADFVKKLQLAGERVAFVGDGINDSPALAQANLGIAVSRASDIARESADFVLLRSEMTGVPEALALARATLRTIKQNLFWAFSYNSVGLPLAALGFVSPMICAAAMGVSDLIVIGNALRLLRRDFSV